MKATKLIFLFFFISTLTYAQVGINNTNPKASLDITATNQANPSNTDGLLIPRIDDFSATNPTAAQQGMLVYLTTTSGTNAPGYYYWDNGSATWTTMLGASDSDFFEAGGTPPNNIADDIYTLGRVKIGSSTFLASDGALNVDSNESYSAAFTNTNTTAVGTRIILNADNSDIKTGVNITLSGTTSGAPYINTGLKFTDLLVGDQYRRGIYQAFLGTNTSTSPLIAIHNLFDNSSEYSGEIFGLINSIESIGDGRHIGAENILKSTGDGFHYGTRNTLEGTGIGFKYGSYNYISNAAGGTHYGVYSDVLSPTGYAGYFLGRVSIGTTTSNNYIFPSTRGTNGQVMRTDGSGILSWVTPNFNDADWYEVGTSSAPNNINDNIFTNGFVGIGVTTPDSKLDVEYTGTKANGVTITYNYTGNLNPPAGLTVKSETSSTGGNDRIYGAYIQTRNSNSSTYSTAVYGYSSADASYNYGVSGKAMGNGTRNIGITGTAALASNINIGGEFALSYPTSADNYGIVASARGGSTTNWAGYFGEYVAPTAGSGNVYIQDLLQVDGNLKFTSGATNNYILKTDASGNATWVNPTTVFTDTDNQQVDQFSLSGTTLSISLQDDGVAPVTVDLSALQDGTGTDDQNISGSGLSGTNLTIGIENGSSQTINLASLQDADWFENGGTHPNNINDNIYTNGKVGINNPSPSSFLDIVSNSTGSIGQISVTETGAGDGARILFKNSNQTGRKWTVYAKADNTDTNNYFNIHNTTTGNILIVRGNGLVGINRTPTTNTFEVNGTASKSTSGSWLANSDRRLKKNIKSIEGKTALEKISKMNGVTYLWNDTQTGIERPKEIQYGFIAQELMQVFPEKVTMDNLGFYQTAYGDYDPIFVEAIKELKSEVEILKDENKQLKIQLAKYESLEARLSDLENNTSIQVSN